MLAASGLNDEVESIFNWNLPSRSMKCVNMKKSSQWSIGSLNEPSRRCASPSSRWGLPPELRSISFCASLMPCSPK